MSSYRMQATCSSAPPIKSQIGTRYPQLFERRMLLLETKALYRLSEMRKCTGDFRVGGCESCLCWLVSEGAPLAAGREAGIGCGWRERREC